MVVGEFAQVSLRWPLEVLVSVGWPAVDPAGGRGQGWVAGGFARRGIRVRGFGGPASCIPCPPFFVG
eukprot:14533687-Heterocapsa_arctica.AAC.1